MWAETGSGRESALSQNEPTPPLTGPPPPVSGRDEAPLQHAVQDAMQDAVQAIADVAMAPVDEVLGHAIWLRWALLCHVLATVAATVVAFLHGFGDWQVYLATGLLTAILIGNFMRWGPTAGWFRRVWTTSFALIIDAVWLLLLFDRARAGRWHPSRWPRHIFAPDASPWFWLPVLLLALCAGFLVAHGILAHHARLRRVHHPRAPGS